jgi:plastocyanin
MTHTHNMTVVVTALAALSALGCGNDTSEHVSFDSTARAGTGSTNRAAASSNSVGAEFNGCTTDMYEDLTAASAKRVIAIAREGLTYSPKCMTIAIGQTVRWEGSLSAHPLAPGNPRDAKAGSPKNPIQPTASGSRVEFRFPTKGDYPYYCTVHGFGTGQRMAGTIRVR